MAHLEFWHEIWANSDTPGFHGEKLRPYFVALESQFLPADKSLAIFVPLCGKAVEMKYLLDLGYKVVGEFFLSLFPTPKNLSEFFSYLV